MSTMASQNHQPHNCLLNRLFRRRSKKTSKLRVTGFCAGNSPVISEFPAQRASNAENVSILLRHHVTSAHQSTSELGHRWFRLWLVASTKPTPGPVLPFCQMNFNENLNQATKYCLSCACIWKCRQNVCHLVRLQCVQIKTNGSKTG